MVSSLRGTTTDRAIEGQTDNFGRAVAVELTDLLDVAGEKDFTPERLRYYKDGTRRFLEYGTDANYSETDAGHLLSPDADQTLTIETAERVAYPVGHDLWPSMSRRLTQAPQAGDAAGGGYGVIDLANFDPSNHTWSGSTADGYFWIHTEATGLDEVVLIGARGGTVFDERVVSLRKAADVLTIIETRLNWYDVGPAVTRQSYTDIASRPLDPQINDVIGAIAADDGKAALAGSHRATMAVSQAAGNTGLALEAGSVGVKTPGSPNFQFKPKSHRMSLSVTNTTDETYEVCGAIRGAPSRPTIKLRISDLSIASTPGSGTNRTEILLVAVDPTAETDASFPADATPVEHNPANSVVEILEDNSITGPVQDDAGTDASGPTTANTMTNPGGYHIARVTIDPEGTGSKTSVSAEDQTGRRELPDTDVCLVLVDSDTSGTAELDVQTEQNS